MKKLKFLALGFLALALVVGVGAVQTNAALTLGALTAASDGALTVTTAVGSAGNLFTTTTTGAVTLGSALTTGDLQIGGTSMAAGVTKIYGGTATGVGTAAGLSLTPGIAGTLVLGNAAGTGAISLGTSTGAQTVNIGTGASGIKTIHIGDGATANVLTIGSTTGAATTTIQAGSGGVVITGVLTATSPVLTTPALGTPSALVLTNATGLPAASVLAGTFGTGAYVMDSSLQVATMELGHATDTTLARSGAGAITVEGTAVLLSGGALGTPASGTLTNATGLPIATGVSGLAAGVATALATPSSANLITAVTDETGTGSLVFATSPTLVTPVLGAATATSVAIGSGTVLTKVTVGNLADGASGWVPDGATAAFTITADAASVGASSFIGVSLGANTTGTCSVVTRTASTNFVLACTGNIDNGATLQYMIVN